MMGEVFVVSSLEDSGTDEDSGAITDEDESASSSLPTDVESSQAAREKTSPQAATLAKENNTLFFDASDIVLS